MQPASRGAAGTQYQDRTRRFIETNLICYRDRCGWFAVLGVINVAWFVVDVAMAQGTVGWQGWQTQMRVNSKRARSVVAFLTVESLI